MKLLIVFLSLLVQASPSAPLSNVRASLQRLSKGLDQHKPTFGAAPDLTDAKHQLRDWIESRLDEQRETIDTRAFAEALHKDIAGANLLCDECSLNVLGYIDDVRVSRENGFLVVVTAMGLSCGYDESAYVYAWRSGRWTRMWEHERGTYTQKDYLPQAIHDVRISDPDATHSRLLMLLGSQTICGGAFKDVYARAWRLDVDARSRLALNISAHAKDDYPPILGRVGPDDVLVAFITGGLFSGDSHQAIRHFKIENAAPMKAVQLDPIAALPRDFVLEWLAAPWTESRARSASASLQAAHAQLRKTNGVGDFPKPTLRCTGTPGSGDRDGLWQVDTHLYEGPRRYYRIRWQPPSIFTMVGISGTPYKDCTVSDERSMTYPKLGN